MHDGVDSGRCGLVVSLLFEPAARVAAQVKASDLVVDEDRQHEGNGRQPPHEPGANESRMSTHWANIIKYLNSSVLNQFMKLTWEGTSSIPCPFRACRRGMQRVRFQRWDRSSEPSCAFPGGWWSYGASCRWSDQPIVRPRWRRRTRCGRWTREPCGRGTSETWGKTHYETDYWLEIIIKCLEFANTMGKGLQWLQILQEWYHWFKWHVFFPSTSDKEIQILSFQLAFPLLNNSVFDEVCYINVPIPVHRSQSNRWWPWNPIAFWYRRDASAGSHSQPWWRSRRRNQPRLGSCRFGRTPSK